MQYLEPTGLPRRRFDRSHHDDAKKAGLHYFGDCDGFDNGGVFWDPSTLSEGFVSYVEIGDPEWLSADEKHDGDRYIECGSITFSVCGEAEIVAKYRNAVIDAMPYLDPRDITIHHIVEHCYYIGEGKDRDDFYMIPMASCEPRKGEYRAKVWTENQVMNFVTTLF